MRKSLLMGMIQEEGEICDTGEKRIVAGPQPLSMDQGFRIQCTNGVVGLILDLYLSL